MNRLLAVLVITLAGCAGTVIQDPATGTVTVNVSAGKVAVATHADLLAAAAYADAHGFPERASMRRAMDALLTAAENQTSACANAILADLPKKPANVAGMGPITLAEAAEEAAGNFVGISARVKTLCAPIPMPILPAPKLP